jgi:hypothetical protein
MASTAAARLLHRRRIRAAVPIISCVSLRGHPARTAAAAGGGRPCGPARRSIPVAVLNGRVRTGAEQRSRCGGVASPCSIVQRRLPAGNGGTGGGTGPPRPHRSAAPAAPKAQKGRPVIVLLDVQRCAGVDERADGRQMAVAHRPVQRRPAIPVQARRGRGRCGPEGRPTSVPVPIPYRLRPRGYPVFFFVFRTDGG